MIRPLLQYGITMAFKISPIIDSENLNSRYLEQVQKFIWDFPNDLDPTDLPDYKEIYILALKFVMGFQHSKDTIRVAVTEMEKFLQWVYRENGKSPKIYDPIAIMDYFNFIKKPPVHWCSENNVRKFITVNGERIANPKWRPFKKLENARNVNSAISKAYSYVNGFFEYLVDCDYVSRNPCARIKRSKLVSTGVDRVYSMMVFTDKERAILFETIDEMAANDSRLLRERFIFYIMIHHYLRESDLAEYMERVPLMGDIQLDSTGFWVFSIHGKGNKKRRIALNEEVLCTLREYRNYHGLSDKPEPSEQTPLLLARGGIEPVKTTRQIRRLISKVFELTALRAERLVIDKTVISKFRNAHCHWLRHSGISHDLNVRKRAIGFVRDDAGHSSVATTSMYLDGDEIERFVSGVDTKD